jgi:hypothetical protein
MLKGELIRKRTMLVHLVNSCNVKVEALEVIHEYLQHLQRVRRSCDMDHSLAMEVLSAQKFLSFWQKSFCKHMRKQ